MIFKNSENENKINLLRIKLFRMARKSFRDSKSVLSFVSLNSLTRLILVNIVINYIKN
jgi:hypothetical protein